MPKHIVLYATAILLSFTGSVFGQDAAEKPNTKGASAKILHEAVISGPLTPLNGKYKLRVTAINLAPGGYVGHHNHRGPGIRLMTVGRMEYVLPNWRTIYGPGDFFFETGDVDHLALNNTNQDNQHLLFEVLPADLAGTSLMTPRKAGAAPDAAIAAKERAAAVPGPFRAVPVADETGAQLRVIHEAVLGGYLEDLNGKYKLRVTEVDLQPNGYIGPHTHGIPGIRLVTSGQIVVDRDTGKTTYSAGDAFFDSGDQPHSVSTSGDSMAEYLIFEIAPKQMRSLAWKAASHAHSGTD